MSGVLPKVVFGITDVISAVSVVPCVRHAARVIGVRHAVKTAAVLVVTLAVFNAVAIPLGMGWWPQFAASALSGLALYLGRNIVLRPLLTRNPALLDPDRPGGGGQ